MPRFDTDKIFELPNIIPTEDDLNKSKEQLLKFINNGSIFRQHIPKQHELNKFIESLKRKVIHDFHLPLSATELKSEYKNSPYFKDILKYVKNQSCRFVGEAHKIFTAHCEEFILMEGLIFKFRYEKDEKEPSLVLCVPEKFIPTVLHMYHSNILSGHPGINKLYLQLRRKFYFPGMYTICRQYVISCFDCQSRQGRKEGINVHYPRIPIDYKPMSRFSMDVKYMPKSDLGYNQILLCTCEVTNYVVGIPIVDTTAHTIAEALFYRIICVFGTPEEIIIDEARSLISDLMMNYFQMLNIRPFIVSPFNHGSNRTERYIRTLNDMICKYLRAKGADWPKQVLPCCYAMNTQISAVTGYSPHEMVFLRKPPNLLEFEINPNEKDIQVGTAEYMKLMKNRLNSLKDLVIARKTQEAMTQWIKDIRKYPHEEGYTIGDLIYLNYESGAELQVAARKLKQEWIGPLRIATILDETHYLISDWEGLLVPIKVHIKRIKPYILNMNQINKDGLLELAKTSQEIRERWNNLQQIEEKLSTDPN